MSEKSLKMSLFPVSVCRAIGGNSHPSAPGGARDEELQQVRYQRRRLGVEWIEREGKMEILAWHRRQRRDGI